MTPRSLYGHQGKLKRFWQFPNREVLKCRPASVENGVSVGRSVQRAKEGLEPKNVHFRKFQKIEISDLAVRKRIVLSIFLKNLVFSEGKRNEALNCS
jgi:hypothetical protein